MTALSSGLIDMQQRDTELLLWSEILRKLDLSVDTFLVKQHVILPVQHGLVVFVLL